MPTPLVIRKRAVAFATLEGSIDASSPEPENTANALADAFPRENLQLTPPVTKKQQQYQQANLDATFQREANRIKVGSLHQRDMTKLLVNADAMLLRNSQLYDQARIAAFLAVQSGLLPLRIYCKHNILYFRPLNRYCICEGKWGLS